MSGEPQSRNEGLLQAIVDGTEYTAEPQSRNEAILLSILNGTEYTAEPQSRIEALLLELKTKGFGKGISGAARLGTVGDVTVRGALIE